jgi:group II intron reverse transcriptase/maturase
MSPHSIGTKILKTKLTRVEERSREDRRTVFNNLGHIIDLELLGKCFHGLDGKKAVGIDGISKDDYRLNLTDNLTDLLSRIRKGNYYPQASRITEIPKSDGSNRPLAIACLEDKIVQEAVKRIVESIFEPLFLDCSHGFRPGKNCQSALVELDKLLMDWENCGALLEIDLRKYFNSIPHDELMSLIRRKISDERFLNLILKLIKAPIVEKDGKVKENEIGCPQGSILSPVLSNIYLHFVIDIWFSWINESKYGGSAGVVRYADDAVVTFRNAVEAEDFKSELVNRLNRFKIEVNDAKTKTILAGRREAARHDSLRLPLPCFTFLGFLHVWGKSKNRKTGKAFWRIKRRTCPKRFIKKIREIKEYIRDHRHERDIISKIIRVVKGYLNYFAVNDNMDRIRKFTSLVKKYLFKYLNRRSQKKSWDWSEFNVILQKANFPKPKILNNLFFNLKRSR